MNTANDKLRPVGIFDSGIGGLTIAKAIHEALPKEELLYFGDTAHLPYGDKSLETIYDYSSTIVDFLIEKDCKMIVIACNSASSAAYEQLSKDLTGTDIALINVIDPLVQYIVNQHYHKVGVIATKATIRSKVFEKKIKNTPEPIDLRSYATPLLAPMIEEGFYNGEISHVIIDSYLSHNKFRNIEALLLACTHYPLIHQEIEDYFDSKVDVIDATELVAADVRKVLESKDMLNDIGGKENSFYVSDYTRSFEETAKMFYGSEINLETIHLKERNLL